MRLMKEISKVQYSCYYEVLNIVHVDVMQQSATWDTYNVMERIASTIQSKMFGINFFDAG